MLEYVHLRSETPTHRTRLCQEFYTQVYRAAFPNPDQSETPETWLPLMADTVPYGQPFVYMVLARDAASQNIMGGIVFEQHRTSRCWIMTYIAVHPEARRSGVARGLIREMIVCIRAACGTHWLLFAESENPDFIVDADEHSVAEQRLRTMDSLGFRGLPITYVQPALAPGKHVLHDLLLLCYAPPNTQIAATQVTAFLIELYAALDQSKSIHLRHMCADLPTGMLQVQRLTNAIS